MTTHGRRQHGGERMKKVIMAAAVLCLGLLLGAGSRSAPFIKTKAYNMLTFVDDRTEKKLKPFSSSGRIGMYVMPGAFEEPFEDFYGRSWGELVIYTITTSENFPSSEKVKEEKILNELSAFCNEHREKLNEMSEYFINAVEDVSDYQDGERLPDIEELAEEFTDEESREIQEKLRPYYPGFDADEGRFKRVYYHYPYDYPIFTVIYLKATKKSFCTFLAKVISRQRRK